MTPSPYLINGNADTTLFPEDRGFSYGDGVFRTFCVRLLTNRCEPNFWALHYKKLVADCNVLGIVCPDSEILLADIRQIFALGEEAVAKIIITRGIGERGYAAPSVAQPTRVLIKTPFPNYPLSNFNEGVRLHLCRVRLSQQPLLAGVKHLNRLENIMARMEWSDNAIADGLLLDDSERTIECTMSNLFARFGKKLITPDLSRCGVAGVTRARILQIASSIGLVAEAADMPFSKLLQADEIIVCNSLYGAWQVIDLNGQRWEPQGLAMQLRIVLEGQDASH